MSAMEWDFKDIITDDAVQMDCEKIKLEQKKKKKKISFDYQN